MTCSKPHREYFKSTILKTYIKVCWKVLNRTTREVIMGHVKDMLFNIFILKLLPCWRALEFSDCISCSGGVDKILHLITTDLIVLVSFKRALKVKKVKLAAKIEGDQKVPFSVATTPRHRGGRYSFPWIASLYPWYVPYIAEC